MTTQWLSIVDFARHYNVSDMTVRRRIKNGKLQAILREGKYYIPYGEGSGEDSSPPAPVSKPVAAAPSFATPPANFPASSATAGSYTPPISSAAPVFTPPAAAVVKVGAAMDSERLLNLPPPPQVVVKAISSPHGESRGLSEENASLVEFCQAALAKFDRVEEQLRSQFQGTVMALEEKIKHLEAALELSKLRETRSLQEVQDLQLLLQMIEQPSP